MNFHTSDWHLRHPNIIGFCDRPFHSMGEMEAALISNYNSVVGDEDTCYFEGDMAMGNREVSIPLLAALNGRKILLAGNHDPCWYGGKKNYRDYIPFYEAAGFEVYPMGPPFALEHEIDGIPVLLSHFPYTGDHTSNDRYSAYRPDDNGLWLIHGHTHSKEVISSIRQYHVGVDAHNMRPVSETEIADTIRDWERFNG